MKEIEAKIMALIHRELSEAEAKQVFDLIDTDVEAKALYEQLLGVSALVEKTVAPAENWKMEQGMRSDLLATLNGESAKLKTEQIKSSPKHEKVVISWRQVTGIAASVAVTLVVAGEVFEISRFNPVSDRLAMSSELNEPYSWKAETKDTRRETLSSSSAASPIIIDGETMEFEVPEIDIDVATLAADFEPSESFVEGFGAGFGAGEELNGLDDSITWAPVRKRDNFESRVKDDAFHFGTGKYRDAVAVYGKDLEKYPYDQETRRGGREVKKNETVYDRVAYDETRARLLTDVDEAWEIVPGYSKNEQSEQFSSLSKIPLTPAAPMQSFVQGKNNGKQSIVSQPEIEKTKEAKLPQYRDKEVSKSSEILLGGLSGEKIAERENLRRRDGVLESNFATLRGREAFINGDYEIAVHHYKRAIGMLPNGAVMNGRRKSLEDSLAQATKALSEVRKREGGVVAAGKPAPPTHDIRNLNDETTAQSEPFSTFSLHVSDVSFKLAEKALLENGKLPERNKIRPEEFVNAFDYGDPSVKGDDKVACFIEQARHPFMQQRNLARVSMSTAALGRSQPLRLTLLLDNSGSMEREDREASVLKAMEILVTQLQPQDEISLISFAQQPRVIAEGLKGAQLQQLVKLVKQVPSEGGTNMEKALNLAGQLTKRHQKDGCMSRIVLMTDGAANLGNAQPEELSKMVENLRQQGIAFDACGVGADKLDDTVLEALARKGDGRYYLLDRPEDADEGFVKQLAGALRPAASNVKVQVKFNPKRVKNYKLLGFEKHLLNKQDFRNDAVDAAELAAQEAGSAMYQFQPMEDGEGNVAEVFVRFRDMNTGQMVERSWMIPYLSQPDSIENAEPSMQLATTAAMVAEKMRNTDVGLVDFSDYGEVLGNIDDHFGKNKRVQSLIQMVRTLSNK